METFANFVMPVSHAKRKLQKRLVVLIHKQNNLLTRLLPNLTDEIPETQCGQITFLCDAKRFLPQLEMLIHRKIEHARIIEVKTREIQIEYRIFLPFGLQFLDGKPFEEIFLASEVRLQRRGQQTLSETARARKKVLFAFRNQLINQIRLIHIEVSLCAEFFEGLDADGQFAECVHGFSITISVFCFYKSAHQAYPGFSSHTEKGRKTQLREEFRNLSHTEGRSPLLKSPLRSDQGVK